jgi:outer membrane protein
VLRSAVDASDASRGRRLAYAWTAAIWTAVLAWAPPVQVQARTDLADITIFGWSLNNVRFGVRVSPDYMGSNDYRLAPSGSINFARRGTQPGFGAPDDGASLGLFSGPDWSAGLTGRVRAPRENDHDLRGFEKVDLAAEGGVFAAYWPKDWLRLRGELRRGVGGHHSWIADLGADAVAREGGLVASLGPRLSWADKDFTRTYFAVDPIEAERSPFGIAPYAPDGPTLAVGLTASAEYRLNRNLNLVAAGRYRRGLGDAADSPIVADLGSPDQFSASLSLRYTLGR